MARMITRGGLLALAAAGLLSGCSDGGDSRASYDELGDEFDALLDRSDPLPITDPSTLPVSGSATYEGVVGLSTPGNDGIPADMLGEMTLVADFSSDDLSGSAGDFVTDQNEELDGRLDISNGGFDRDADVDVFYTFGFDLDGTLTTEDGDDLDVDAEAVGDFLGEDNEQAIGLVDGIIVSPEGAAVTEGGFIVER